VALRTEAMLTGAGGLLGQADRVLVGGDRGAAVERQPQRHSTVRITSGASTLTDPTCPESP
jgi:hypothetical protein